MTRLCLTLTTACLLVGCSAPAPEAPASAPEGAPELAPIATAKPPAAEPVRYLGMEKLLASFEAPKSTGRTSPRGKRRRR